MLEAQTIPAPSASTSSKRLRVSILGSLPPNKGVSPYTADLVDALSSFADVDLEVLTFSSIYPAWLYPGGKPDEPGAVREFPNARVRRFIAWYNPLTWLWAGLSLNGDVVHAQWWSFALAPVYATVLMLARLRGKKVLLTLHNVEPHEKSKLKRYLNSLTLRFADRLVVHSRANQAQLEGRGRSLSADVIPMGVAPSVEQAPDAATARSRLGIPGGARVVLHFGNVRPYKGVDVLLKAFARVAAEMPDAILLLAGKPWGDWARYDGLIDTLGIRSSVRCVLDYVPTPEVPLYFRAADLVVLPYVSFEAQSAVGSQALSYGKPMVVSDAGGLPDLVRDPDCVVPAGDVEALAAALMRALDSPEQLRRLAADSQALAEEFSVGGVARRTVEVYRALLAQEG